MPDIGFSELLLVAVIAIIVLGPEKLPEAMVNFGKFIGKIKRMWNDATADIRKEIELEEMKEEMQKYKEELRKLQEKVDNDVKEGLKSVDELTALGNRKMEIK
jgi:sec-independent protein translocase protein TatB